MANWRRREGGYLALVDKLTIHTFRLKTPDVMSKGWSPPLDDGRRLTGPARIRLAAKR